MKKQLSLKQIQEKTEAIKRRKKYLIVAPDGLTSGGATFISNIGMAYASAARCGGIVLSYTNRLPDGINEYVMEVWDEDLNDYFPVLLGTPTAKTLWWWWDTEGKCDLNWKWKKGVRRRWLCNGQPIQWEKTDKKLNVDFDFPRDDMAPAVDDAVTV